MAGIRLHNLCKTYGKHVVAVGDVSLEIADGELAVLVGPSGCGKSTTLRMIAGLEEPTSGDIYIGDRRVNDIAPASRDVAMVFQNYALYPHMTVRQNLAFGLKMRRTPRAEIRRRVDEVASTLGIGSLLDRRPKQLSGGERQRVALGRAIVRNPLVFLFDEPLSNLDATLRVQMRTEITALHQRLGTTMVYVTHDQTEAMTLGQRIVVIHEGRVQQYDTPLNVYHRPANRFVAGFIGSPAMNFVSGEVAGGSFRYQDATIPLDQSAPEGPAVLGIRPEDLGVGVPGPRLPDVQVEVVEQMGHETMVYFELDGQRQVARLPADADYRVGQSLSLSMKRGAWHLFAKDAGGQRL